MTVNLAERENILGVVVSPVNLRLAHYCDVITSAGADTAIGAPVMIAASVRRDGAYGER